MPHARNVSILTASICTCLLATLAATSVKAAIDSRALQVEIARPLNFQNTPSETIRVRLSKLKTDRASFSGVGLRFTGMTTALQGYRAIIVRPLRLSDGSAMWIVTDRDRGGELVRVMARSFELQGSSVRVGLKAAPDRLRLTSGFDLIATLDLEDYLRGVLPSEMPASWPVEALKAQAIAARTFAVFKKNQRRDSADFDVEANVMDQVFNHPLEGSDRHPATANVEQAISETKSIVLVGPNQEAFQTFFHADCGGQTEEAKEVWGGGARTGTAVDGFCPLNPRATWSTSYSSSELSKKLASLYKKSSSSLITGAEVVKRTGSGRIAQMRLLWNDGSVTPISGHLFRMTVGYDRVKSTQFKIESNSQSKTFQLSGLGYGHGVGMCQWGAKKLALTGKTYQEILSHYYSKAQFARLGSPRGSNVASITSTRRL